MIEGIRRFLRALQPPVASDAPSTIEANPIAFEVDESEVAELHQSRTRGALTDQYLGKLARQFKDVDDRLVDVEAEVEQLSGERFRARRAAREAATREAMQENPHVEHTDG